MRLEYKAHLLITEVGLLLFLEAMYLYATNLYPSLVEIVQCA